MKNFDEQTLARRITYLLKWGIALSSLTTLLGGLLFLIHHGQTKVLYKIFNGEPAFLTEVRYTFKQAIRGNSVALIQLGAVILMATPIARVLLCLLTFAKDRDWTYFLICTLTAILLICSFAGVFISL